MTKPTTADGYSLNQLQAARGACYDLATAIRAFVLLKALAFHNRKENKDAYDIDYVLRHFGESVDDINTRLKPLLDDVVAQEAIGYLRQDFAQMDSIGPSRAAVFLGRQDDDAFRADVADLVQRLLRGLR